MKPFIKHVFKLSGILTALMVLSAGVANATTYYSKSGATAANLVASWTTSSTGVGGSAPGNFTTAGDIFIIRAGQSMNTTNTWAVTGSLQISATASLTTGTTNTWTMSIGGTTTVSGTLTLKNTATKTFTGDVTVPSGGSMILFAGSKQVTTHNLIVNSGGTLTHNTNYDNATTILEVLGNLDISGTYTYTGFAPAVIMDAPSGTWNINTQNTSLCMLFLKNAIYKCTGDVTVDNQFYAMWNLDAGEFHTNGFDVTATTWGLVNAGGTVFVDGGSLTIGGAVGGILTGHTGPTGANGHITVSSGTLTTTGLYVGVINASPAFTFTSTVTQSGGIVNADAIIIDGSTTASKYLMSGGTLNVGGPLNITSPSLITCSNSPVINTGTLSNGGTFTAAGSALTVAGGMVNSGTFTANTSNIKVGGDWTNSGTFTCNTSTVTFNGGGNQTISNTNATAFNNFIVNPSLTTATATLAGNNISVVNNLTVTTGIFDMATFTGNQAVAAGTFNLASGTTLRLAGANNFPSGYTTIALNATAVPTTTVEYYGVVPQSVSSQTYGYLTFSNNSTKTAANNVSVKADVNINSSAVFAGGSYSHIISGNWYNNVSSSAYTPGTSTVTFNGGSGQIIGGTAGTTFNSLIINDVGGVTIAQDQTVNNLLTLTSGNVTIGSNNLIFGNSALAVSGTFSGTRMIVADGTGQVRKNYSAVSGSFVFPIGDNTGTAEYSPITLNFTAGTSGGGAYAGVNVTNAKHPNNASTTDYLKRYWTVSTSAMISPSFDVTATYTTADIAGTEGNIAAAKFNVAIPWIKYGVLGSNTLTATAVANTGAGIIFSGITNQVPIATISGGGVNFCAGGSASLSTVVTNNGTSTISYLWSPSTGLSSTTVSNPTASPASTTTYTLTITDGNGIINSPLATTTITVNPNNTAGAPSSTPTLCISTALTNITIATTGATAIANDGVAGANGLPGGVSAHWAANVITISGTPTASGIFSYSIALTGGCGAVNATGTITVTANNTAGAPSSTPTLCISTALTNITIATTGATAIANDGVAGANGLPGGVSAHWAANVITISGTPTASGIFSYSIALTGGCGAVNATGTITVTANNTAGAPSSTPTLCISTALTNITIATTGATAIANDGVAGANGLPGGVSAHWAANVITISGTPTASGIFSYSIALTGGCGAVNATGTITVTANNTAGAPSSTPTLCISTALTNITIATTGATAIANDNVAGANGLPAGVKAHWVGNVITISGTPTASGIFSYSIALTSGCGTVNATGTITVTANNTAGAPSSTPTLCISTALTNITIATTGATAIANDNVAGANGLPAGVKAHWVGNVITISGTPTASGIFSYSIALTGGCGAVNATGTITVTANNTAGAPSSTPTLCISTALTNITIATTGATAIANDNVAGANGLPAGVKAHWVGNVITISGTPTASGIFSYSIALTGGCGAVNATGTITVTANNTAGAPSSTPTLCISTALTNITIATTGATAIANDGVAGANGLPGGVSAHWAANVITISGTPTASGIFSYSIALTGGCGAVNATGTITVTANNTAGAPSSTPTLCISTALTNITIATTGATAIANDGVAGANGLPGGVSAHWAANVITISGTPTASGIFSYSIALTGGCGAVNATGTITVTANNTAGAPSSTPTLCISTALTNITIATTGATAIANDNVAGANGLPAGVKAHWVGNVITISGTPTASGIFSYSIALTGGCGAVNATGTITVTANNTAGAPSSTPTLCISTALTNITIATTGATAIANDGVAGANGLPGGVSAHWAANVITISGTPTASGIFSYSIALTGGCGAVNATGTITVTANNTAGAPSSTPTLCISTALTNITIATTGATAIANDGVAGANGLPAGVKAHWVGNVITISGTPTASGIFSYSIALTGGCGAVNATGTITVTANNTAGAPSSTPTLCISTALTNITIATTGATAIANDGVAGANGLPGGVSAHWAANVITISGTPTASGIFSYSIALTGGCGAVNATGTITVTANNTAGAPSSTPTLCISTALTNITIATTGATAIANDGVAGANGLPGGVSAHWAANVITISGTPTASGIFSYSIALTGGCGAVNATGTITVTANNTAGAPSSTPTLCISTALTNITIATTGATAIANDGVAGANGLPGGVSAHWAANVITISGTPTASGIFSYSIALTGGCGAVNATGTITVTANNTAGAPSSTPTLCISTALTNITIATTGATAIANDGVAGANGLPAGVKAHWVGNVITISGTPTASGIFSYSIALTGGCGAINATGTMTVNPSSVGGTVSGSAAVCFGTNSGTLTLSGQTGSVVRWEYSIDGGTTWNTIVNTTITQSYTNLTVTTMYRAVMQSGVCASANSAAATLTVTTPPSATISYATPFCFNSGTATVTRTGTAGGSYSSTAGLVINSASGDINLTISSPGQYTITYTVAAAGGCSLYTTNTAVIINPNTWTGTVSTDWNTAANWLGNAVPTTSCADVTILAGVPYQPTLGSGIATIQNIFVNSGAILTVSNATLQLSGTINNSGTFDVSNGAIEMNGSGSQTIPANAFQSNALKDLIISNSSSGGVIIGGALDVYGSLTYTGTGMKLITNDFLALKSNATNTAWIGDMTGNTITGKVSVERYISAHRAWRFLSVPTNTTETIKESWQENQAANNTSLVGWGTQISSNRATWSADGFDFYSTGGPSMKIYNSSTAAWDGITGTNIGIKATDGYMTFIRGDRSANGAGSTPTVTVMRTKGDLYTGDQAPIIIPAGKFSAIGNPYASALDMRYITKAGVKNFFYLWDPNIGGTFGLGGYQTFSYNGSDYEVTPGMGSYGASGSVSNYIQSGLAFFVQATGSGGSVTLKEGAKTGGSSQVSIAVRPAQSPVTSPVGLSQSKLRTNLYGVNADNSTYIVDGVLNNYGNDYSNKVDDMDAIKSANTNENLSIKTDNQLLVVERRHTITQQDTIFLTIGHVKVQKYRFEFTGDFNQPGLTGYLEDSYLNTRTLLNMNGTMTADFSIVNIPGAYAANRFRIVFTQASVLPLTITSVKAYQVNKNIAVEWNTANESNMKQYEVEKSVDGNHYSKANTVDAHNAVTNKYSWLDAQPVSGYNYYRIKSIDINGEAKYSTVVKVFIGTTTQEITVYPNPVTNNTINLQLVNQPAGNYKVKLLNNMGQQVLEKDIEHAEGSSTELIPVKQSLSKGIYQLQVIKTDGSITTNKLIF